MSLGKEYLIGKKVGFKLKDSTVYLGVFQYFDEHGFWISSPDLINQLRQDASWKRVLPRIEAGTPVCYIPITTLDYMLVPED